MTRIEFYKDNVYFMAIDAERYTVEYAQTPTIIGKPYLYIVLPNCARGITVWLDVCTFDAGLHRVTIK